jgi:hypothetical protein
MRALAQRKQRVEKLQTVDSVSPPPEAEPELEPDLETESETEPEASPRKIYEVSSDEEEEELPKWVRLCCCCFSFVRWRLTGMLLSV